MSNWPREAEVGGDATISWMYPSIYQGEKPSRLRITMYQVRSARDLLLGYDSKRDGWVVMAEPTTEEDGVIYFGDPEEVAFVPAWSTDATDD